MINLPPRPERKRLERDILNEIIAAASRIRGVRLARNNTGRILDSRGIPVCFGLGEGGPDLVGVITFGGLNTCEPFAVDEVRHAMLRTLDTVAVAIGIEVKQPKRYANPNQRAWHAAAKRRGIRVTVCRSPEEAVSWIEATREELRFCLRRLAGCLA